MVRTHPVVRGLTSRSCASYHRVSSIGLGVLKPRTALNRCRLPNSLPFKSGVASSVRSFSSSHFYCHPNSVLNPVPQVPTIDISSYLQDRTSHSAANVVNTVRSACQTTGFFQITGHGVDPRVVRGVLDASKAFYALPAAEKARLDIKQNVGFRGYDGLGTQKYSEDVLPDLKESFFVGQPVSPKDPNLGRILTGPNVWPNASALPEPLFRQPVEQYYSSMHALSRSLFSLLADTLPYGPGVFDAFLADLPLAPMRLLHYPPQPNSDAASQTKKQLGASEHTDFGAITILLQDGVAGLQVWRDDGEGDDKAGQWIDVHPEPGAFVINIADMMTRWTNGAYKSSLHRVLNAGGSERFSVAFFFDGNIDCKLDPLDGSLPAQGSGTTVEGHMKECLTRTYTIKK